MELETIVVNKKSEKKRKAITLKNTRALHSVMHAKKNIKKEKPN